MGEISTEEIAPEKAVKTALEKGCDGISFTFNEPVVWMEYTLDTAEIAHNEGLFTTYVTNGFLSEEVVSDLKGSIDAAVVGIKGFSKEFYRNVNRAGLDGVIDACKLLVEKSIHVEMTYLVIPGYTDRKEDFHRFLDWVHDLKKDIPVHLTRFFGADDFAEIPPTPLETLEHFHEIARTSLDYVYLGNVYGHKYENTYCPDCGSLLIERKGYESREEDKGSVFGNSGKKEEVSRFCSTYDIGKISVDNGRCSSCGKDINVIQ